MINREMLRNSINQIATNDVGTLQSVDGNRATVVIDNQVYPDMMLSEIFTCEDYEVTFTGNGTVIGTCNPFKWEDHIGKTVLVSLLQRNHSKGVVVGVIM